MLSDRWFRYASVLLCAAGVTLAAPVWAQTDPDDDEGRALVGRIVGLSFRVEDIHRACRELEQRGVHFTGLPERQPWGGTLAHFCDSERNIFSLVEHPSG